jgi:outer membrane protein OmpA-like peptidoglycan-associated protein
MNHDAAFRCRSFAVFSLLLLLGVPGVPSVPVADAQLLDRIKNRVTNEAIRYAEKKAVEAARRSLDLAEDAIVCAATDQKCIKDARAKGKEPVIVDEDGKPISGYEPASGQAAGDQGAAANPNAAGQGVWANYDFVSGERVIYYHDFEGTRTGNFPSRLDYIAGNLDVVELGENRNKVLRVGEGASESGPGGAGCFTIALPETLPERYTIEFKVLSSDPLRRSTLSLFSDGSDNTPDTRCTYPPRPHVLVGGKYRGLELPGSGKSGMDKQLTPNQWADVAITVDGPYWKMYVDGERVANVPRYDFPRAPKLHVFMTTYRYSLMVDDIRIAEGGPRSLYDDLQAEGFVSTTAIRFDTGSATLRPESTGILNDVLAMLRDHEDIELLIEGHTDSQGSDASNQTLSEQRAAAVAAFLTGRGIDAGRLDTAGHGESQAVADNTTDEGRAMNRRVVFRQR